MINSSGNLISGSFGWIPLPLTPEDAKKVQDAARASGLVLAHPGVEQSMSVQDVKSPLHLSLSKRFFIDSNKENALRDALARELRPVFKRKLSMSVNGINMKIMHNEAKTRSYVVLPIKDEHPNAILQQLTLATDKALSRFGAPPYFENPEFHVSVLWARYSPELELVSDGQVDETELQMQKADLNLQTIEYRGSSGGIYRLTVGDSAFVWARQ